MLWYGGGMSSGESLRGSHLKWLDFILCLESLTPLSDGEPFLERRFLFALVLLAPFAELGNLLLEDSIAEVGLEFGTSSEEVSFCGSRPFVGSISVSLFLRSSRGFEVPNDGILEAHPSFGPGDTGLVTVLLVST